MGSLERCPQGSELYGAPGARTFRMCSHALEGTDARSACHGFTNKLLHMPAPLSTTLTDDPGKGEGLHERFADPQLARPLLGHRKLLTAVLASSK